MMDKDILMLTFGKQISKGSDVSELTTKVTDCLDQIKKIRGEKGSHGGGTSAEHGHRGGSPNPKVQ